MKYFLTYTGDRKEVMDNDVGIIKLNEKREITEELYNKFKGKSSFKLEIIEDELKEDVETSSVENKVKKRRKKFIEEDIVSYIEGDL